MVDENVVICGIGLPPGCKTFNACVSSRISAACSHELAHAFSCSYGGESSGVQAEQYRVLQYNMRQVVFYSWQSDLPNSCNRGFIKNALEVAATTIKADETVEVEPVVDRDTLGVPGAPDIASTIFSKITAADVFVADVSIIGRDGKRATPNPNVLVELGYAMKALGHERMILVFNKAFGQIEELPFDLRMRRVLTYSLSSGQPKDIERKVLERALEEAIRAALQEDCAKSIEPPAIPSVSAVEGQQPNRTIVLRRNLESILKTLDSLQPPCHSKGGTVAQLIEALSKTHAAVAEFTKIAEMIALMDDQDAALELYRWFGHVFERYNNPKGFSGTSSNADHDFFKFLGHELFVTFVALLIRENRWTLLGTVLEEPIPMRYIEEKYGPGTASWDYASEHLPSILDESNRHRRACLHAEILNERHTTGGGGESLPIQEFVAGDYLLYLLGEMSPEKPSEYFMRWRAWSAFYLDRTPLFLRAAEHRRVADQILKLFKLANADEFKRLCRECTPRLRKLFHNALFWSSPVSNEDIERFGTR